MGGVSPPPPVTRHGSGSGPDTVTWRSLQGMGGRRGGWRVSLPQCFALGPPRATQGGWGAALAHVTPHRPYGRWGGWG